MATPRLIISVQTTLFCLSLQFQLNQEMAFLWQHHMQTAALPGHSGGVKRLSSKEGVGKGPGELSARKRQAALRPVGAPSSREEEAEPILCSAPREARPPLSHHPLSVRRGHGCTRSKIRGLHCFGR